MTLYEYMRIFNFTLKEMQKRTGINFRVLSRYNTGESYPSLINAHKIYIATNKKVNLKDWF